MRLDTATCPPKIVWIGVYSEGADTLSRDSRTAYAELMSYAASRYDENNYALCVTRLLQQLVDARRLGWGWVVPLLRPDSREEYDKLLAAEELR
jgi:hypothetical protein